MTTVWVIVVMVALLRMHEGILGGWRCCPACGGRDRHHSTCPYKDP